MKVCPDCSSMIPETAKKCRFCGAELTWEAMKTQIIEQKSFQMAPSKIYCPQCGYEGKTTKTKQKWNGCITGLLLLLGIIPWLIYMVRRGKRYYVCPKCWNPDLVNNKQ